MQLEGDKKATKESIMQAARHMPYLSGVRQAIDNIHQQRHATPQMILSDGNTLFIQEFLQASRLEKHFRKLVSNVGFWNEDTNSLQVIHQSQQYGGHSCPQCPQNLCKTQALVHTLDELFSEWNNNGNTQTTVRGNTKRPRLVYVGDGTNDACPAIHVLQEGDILLARTGSKPKNANRLRGVQTRKEHDDDDDGTDNDKTKQTKNEFGLLPRLERYQQQQQEQAAPIKCQVLEWQTGEELRELVDKVLEDIPS